MDISNMRKAFTSLQQVTQRHSKTTGLGDAMNNMLNSTMTACGIKSAHIEYLYSVSAVDDATRKKYFERVYQLGKEF